MISGSRLVKVAFIGMGTMGAPMALNLLKAGHEVTVHNRTCDREIPLAEAGAARAENSCRRRPGHRRGDYLRQRHPRCRTGHFGPVTALSTEPNPVRWWWICRPSALRQPGRLLKP